MLRSSVHSLRQKLCPAVAIPGIVFEFVVQTSSIAYALPQGGQVSGGQAAISSLESQTTINQSSQRAVIDWSSFNVGENESVRFNQPSASAIALNRIHDTQASQIDGSVSANGQVWLLNPNGMVFGRGAQINVGGLLVTTANIDNARFMAGDYRFDMPGNPNAAIVNHGNITIRNAGLAALVAPHVSNTGVITADLGQVHLASGDTFALDLYGDGLINLAASDAVLDQLVDNSGTINVNGGTVKMTAAVAQSAVNNVINMGGILNARAVGTQAGQVVIAAPVQRHLLAPNGRKLVDSTVLVSGTVDASGAGSGQKGGNVTVTGDHVGVLSGARIDASGAAGGGNIKIGGDFHGGGDTPTAGFTLVESGAVIDTDASEYGQGGKVAVWSDDHTDFAGTITARGGSQGGNGGFVETSGHNTLAFHGTGSAAALHGNAGTWLLDPNNVTINASATSNPSPFTANWTSTGASNVLYSDIQAFLNGGTNVTINASGSITVAHNITKSAGGDAALDLEAGTDIIVNSNIAISSTSNKLNVTLDADTALGGGSIQMASGSSITTNGGNIVMGGQGNPTTQAAVGDATYTDGIQLNKATLNAGGGNISLRGTALSTSSGTGLWIHNNAVIQTTGTGTLTITGIGGNSGATAHGVQIGDTGDTTTTISVVNGDMSIAGTGGSIGGSDGVLIQDSATVETTGTGNISVTGSGGGTNGSNSGIELISNGIIKSTASTGDTTKGTITLQGTGGGAGTGGSNKGVAIGSNGTTGQVTSVDGSIFITGTGGSGSGSNNEGVTLGDGSSMVKTTGIGNISLTGNGGTTSEGAGNNQTGVEVFNGGIVQASGTGSINLTGTGGTGTGGSNYGIWMDGPTAPGISTVSGSITMTGIRGSGSSNYGFDSDNTSGIVIGGDSTTGNLTMTQDTWSIGTGTTFKTSGALTLQPQSTDGTGTVRVGNAGAGNLLVTNTYLGYLNLGTASSLTIGNATAGDMVVNTTTSFTKPVTFVSGGNITLSHQLTDSYNGTAVVFAAGGNFSNSVGAAAINLTGGGSPRWLIYSTSASGDTPNGLAAVNSVYGKTYVSYPPSSVTELGNTWIYAQYLGTITLTADDKSMTYGGGLPSFTYSFSCSTGCLSNVMSGAPSLATAATSSSNAGTYSIVTAQGTVSASGYQFTYVNGPLSINPAPLTVTASAGQSKVYGAANPGAYTYGYAGLTNGDTAAVFSGALSRAAGENVGTYAIGQGTLSAGGNYTITYNSDNFAITPASLTVTANAGQSKVYGAANPAYTYGYAGLVNGDTSAEFSGTLTRAAGENAGNYAIGQGTLSAGGNYTITYNSDNFVITPASLTVTANAGQSKVYGAANPAYTYGYAGLTNGDTAAVFSGALSRAAGENVGTYAIGQGTLSAGSNYTITYNGDNFAITPASLTVTASAGQSKVYGAANPGAYTYGYAGLTNGDTAAVFSGALSRAAGENVGTYAINQGTLSAGGNYTISFTSAHFSILADVKGGDAAEDTSLAAIVSQHTTFTQEILVMRGEDDKSQQGTDGGTENSGVAFRMFECEGDNANGNMPECWASAGIASRLFMK